MLLAFTIQNTNTLNRQHPHDEIYISTCRRLPILDALIRLKKKGGSPHLSLFVPVSDLRVLRDGDQRIREWPSTSIRKHGRRHRETRRAPEDLAVIKDLLSHRSFCGESAIGRGCCHGRGASWRAWLGRVE